jgi:hypothetical protein
MESSGMPGRLVVALPTLSESHGMAALRVDTGRATRGLLLRQNTRATERAHFAFIVT